jgi:hypothetical protein
MSFISPSEIFEIPFGVKRDVWDQKRRRGDDNDTHFVLIAKKKPTEFIDKIEEIDIRGNDPCNMEYYQCEECGEDFEIPRPDYDPLDAPIANFAIGRKAQPEEIKKFVRVGVTQKD